MSQVDLARAVGVSAPAVHDWVKGKIKNLSAQNADKVSRALHINSHWLLHGRGPRDVHSNTAAGPAVRGMVPLISWVQAGTWGEAIDLLQPGDGEEWLPCAAAHSVHTYALRVEGDSMTAPYGRSYPHDCIIFVDPEQIGGIVNGDRVIAKAAGANLVTFKVYVEDGPLRFLRPLNPQYPTITGEFRLLGKVIGTWIPE